MKQTMKALVLTKVGKLEYMDVPKPVPGKGESLVRVMSCGICGSDIPRAYKDGAHNMPLIIGHEFSGIVESVGDDVDSSWIGKRVGIFPLIPCMNCKPCLDGMYEMCRNRLLWSNLSSKSIYCITNNPQSLH